MEVTIFKNIQETNTPFYKSVDVVFDRIKKGNSKNLVDGIRNEQDNDLRNKIKKNLPSVCFSGKFTKRADSAILEHSGLICLDFDKFPSEEEMVQFNEFIQKDKYTFASFVSPSGNGYKVVVKIPKDHKFHKMYFDALNDYYESPYFDSVTKNLSRVCYESYDPNIYINKDSEVWTVKADFEQFETKERKAIIQVDNVDDKIKALMVWFNKKYSMTEGGRNDNLFKLVCAFNQYGVGKLDAISFCSQFEQNGFTAYEIGTIIDSAYKKVEDFGTKYFENSKVIDNVSRKIRGGTSKKDIKKYLKETVGLNDDGAEEAIVEIEKDSSVNEFWTYNDNGGVVMVNHKFKYWLMQNGFYKFYPEGSDSYVFVRKQNNLVSDTSEARIKDFVLDYLERQENIQVYEYFVSRTKFFKEDFLSFLSNVEVMFNKDTKNSSFLYFRNKAVKVTKDNVELIDYMHLDGYVWEKHIIDRDFEINSKFDNDFSSLVFNISGQDESKEASIKSTIGYLLHSYKSSADNVAVILNDEMISENPNGGTGKGIFISALSKLKRVVVIDGKSFDTGNSFPYQTVSADTHLLVFDDVKKNFNFEFLFSLITEGITLEKKNKDAIKLPIERSPKILISTNYAIKGEGNSFDRRKHDLEFTQHYSKNRTPEDEFGRLLFDDWGHKDWVKFDNYMVQCLRLYLDGGLVTTDFNNLDIRRFIAATSFEFYEWVSEEDNLPLDNRIYKSSKFQQYLEDNPDSKKWLTIRRFSIWIDKYAQFKGYRILSGKDMTGRWIDISEKPSKEDVTF
jgi:hypothetical protein